MVRLLIRISPDSTNCNVYSASQINQYYLISLQNLSHWNTELKHIIFYNNFIYSF